MNAKGPLKNGERATEAQFLALNFRTQRNYAPTEQKSPCFIAN